MAKLLLLLISIGMISSCSKSKDLDTSNPPPVIIPPNPVPPTGLTNETTTVIFFTSSESDGIGGAFTSFTCLNSDLSLKWKKINIGTGGTPNCFIENGKVFLSTIFFSMDATNTVTIKSNIYCFEQNTGNIIWNRLQIPETLTNPTVKNDTIFTSRNINNTNSIAAYSGSNGSLYWNVSNFDQFPPYQLSLDGNNFYYFAAANNTAPIRCESFNLTSRTLRWSNTQNNSFTSNISAPAFSNDKLGFTVGSALGSKTLVVLNKNNGSIAWSKTSNIGSPISSDDKFFAVDADQGLYAFNAQTGATIWQINLGNQIRPVSSLFLSGENLYLVAQGPDATTYIYSINANTGNLNYRTKIHRATINQQLVVVGKNIYTFNFNIASNNTSDNFSKFYVSDASTGNLKDSININALQVGSIGIVGSSGKIAYSR